MQQATRLFYLNESRKRHKQPPLNVRLSKRDGYRFYANQKTLGGILYANQKKRWVVYVFVLSMCKSRVRHTSYLYYIFYMCGRLFKGD